MTTERIERDRKRAIGVLAKFEEPAAPAQDPQVLGIWYKRGKEFALIPTDFLKTHEFYAPRRTKFNARDCRH